MKMNLRSTNFKGSKITGDCATSRVQYATDLLGHLETTVRLLAMPSYLQAAWIRGKEVDGDIEIMQL